jgi:pimeloyl-ACP methyl ester carboxylesterase
MVEFTIPALHTGFVAFQLPVDRMLRFAAAGSDMTQRTGAVAAAGSEATAKEARFRVNGLHVAAKIWGNADGIPTIGLHGWLDNANTFDALAPLLPELRLVALDLPGHGLSDHRPPGVHYESAVDVQDVLAVARAIRWKRFALLGHSRGGSIAAELAGLFPEHVTRAVMIDGYMEGDDDANDAVASRRRAVEQMLDAHEKQPPRYSSIDEMVERVMRATDQSRDAAAALVARGHKAVPGGFTWRTDPRIRFRSPHGMTSDQVDVLMRQTRAPSLLIMADQGDRWYRDGVERWRRSNAHLRVKSLAGPHHLHLEQQAPDVATLIREFFTLDQELGAGSGSR